MPSALGGGVRGSVGNWLAVLLWNMQLVCVPTRRRRYFDTVPGPTLGKEWVLLRARSSAGWQGGPTHSLP